MQAAWRVLGQQASRRSYDAQLANSRLAEAQGAAVAATFALRELGALGEGEVGAVCRFPRQLCRRQGGAGGRAGGGGGGAAGLRHLLPPDPRHRLLTPSRLLELTS